MRFVTFMNNKNICWQKIAAAFYIHMYIGLTSLTDSLMCACWPIRFHVSHEKHTGNTQILSTIGFFCCMCLSLRLKWAARIAYFMCSTHACVCMSMCVSLSHNSLFLHFYMKWLMHFTEVYLRFVYGTRAHLENRATKI